MVYKDIDSSRIGFCSYFPRPLTHKRKWGDYQCRSPFCFWRLHSRSNQSNCLDSLAKSHLFIGKTQLLYSVNKSHPTACGAATASYNILHPIPSIHFSPQSTKVYAESRNLHQQECHLHCYCLIPAPTSIVCLGLGGEVV